MRHRTIAIVPAAGKGSRLGLRTKKPFVLINGKPLIIHTLEKLNSSPLVDAIVVAAEKECVGRLNSVVKRYGLGKVLAVVAGGATRFDSVANCLREVTGAYDTVMIHDGARPFVGKEIIKRSIRAAQKYGACVTCVPESDTVKLAGTGSVIRETLDRTYMYRAQTPQVFKRRIIMDAYKRRVKGPPTDDSELVEAAGYKVRIVNGSYSNIKVTTREDLELAKAILSRRPTPRPLSRG